MSALVAIAYAVAGGWTGAAIVLGWAVGRMGPRLNRTPKHSPLTLVVDNTGADALARMKREGQWS